MLWLTEGWIIAVFSKNVVRLGLFEKFLIWLESCGKLCAINTFTKLIRFWVLNNRFFPCFSSFKDSLLNYEGLSRGRGRQEATELRTATVVLASICPSPRGRTVLNWTRPPLNNILILEKRCWFFQMHLFLPSHQTFCVKRSKCRRWKWHFCNSSLPSLKWDFCAKIQEWDDVCCQRQKYVSK